MNRSVFVSVFAAACAAVAAGETNAPYIDMITGKPIPPDSPYTEEQYRARDERVLKKTGGFLDMPAEGPVALLVDAREKERKTLDEVARLYRLGAKLEIGVAREPAAGKSPLEAAQGLMAERGPLMLVMVVDGCRELPALSVFPEERIGIVNADRLQEGDDPSLPEVRVAKEVWRAIGFIGGIGFSKAENDMMQPYYTLEELDGNNNPFIQPMNMLKMQKFWTRFGVKRARRLPYRVAVQEGWAQPPTNDYQRAIWDEVHSATNATEKAAAPAAK